MSIHLALLALGLCALTRTSEACLGLLRPGEDVCTDRSLCQTFVACDLRSCEDDKTPSVCAYLRYKDVDQCMKRYKNECEFNVAKCKNADIQRILCPPFCPEVPSGQKLVHCADGPLLASPPSDLSFLN